MSKKNSTSTHDSKVEEDVQLQFFPPTVLEADPVTGEIRLDQPFTLHLPKFEGDYTRVMMTLHTDDLQHQVTMIKVFTSNEVHEETFHNDDILHKFVDQDIVSLSASIKPRDGYFWRIIHSNTTYKFVASASQTDDPRSEP